MICTSFIATLNAEWGERARERALKTPLTGYYLCGALEKLIRLLISVAI